MQQLCKGTLLQGGTYKIEQMLGQGSFGITYLATHTALDKKVAIKEFFMKEFNGRDDEGSVTGMSDGSLSMDYARKFQKEAQNLARLEHPNIVRVTDYFEDNSTFYYVMDYIDGQNLNEYLKMHHVSQQEAVDIIRDVAEALRYMHEEKHMLHLDLKPGNIMRRTTDSHILLIDFGLSKHYSNTGQPETSTTIGLGTAGYAPVEQANQAKNGEFRPTIDVYALGATLYKLLTRETPPVASDLVSDDELLPDKLRQYNIDKELSAVVINAMLPNVRKRTQNVRTFLRSLSADVASPAIDIKGKEETQVLHGYCGSSEETRLFESANPEREFVGKWKSIRKQDADDCLISYSMTTDYRANHQSSNKGIITVSYKDVTERGKPFNVKVTVDFRDSGQWNVRKNILIEKPSSLNFFNLHVSTSIKMDSASLADLENQWTAQLEEFKNEMMQEIQSEVIVKTPNFIRMKSDGNEFLLERI